MRLLQTTRLIRRGCRAVAPRPREIIAVRAHCARWRRPTSALARLMRKHKAWLRGWKQGVIVMCRSATACSADDHQEAEVRPGSLKAGIKGAHAGMVLMPLLFPPTMPAARLSRRRKSSHALCTSRYAMCAAKRPLTKLQSRLLSPASTASPSDPSLLHRM